MNLKKIFENSVWYGLVPRLPSLVTVLLMPIITPFLTKTDYGQWGVINSYSGIVMSICGLGLQLPMGNSFFKYHRNSNYRLVWRRIFFLMQISSVLLSIILFMTVYSSITTTMGLFRLSVAFTTVIPILLYPNQVMVETFYTLSDRPRLFVIGNLLGTLLGIFVSYFSIVQLKLGYFGWLLSAATSSGFVFIFFFRPIWLDEKIYPYALCPLRRILKWFRVSLPITLHILGNNLLTTSDRIIMGILMVSLEDVGLYTNGFQFGGYITILVGGLLTAIGPTHQYAYRGNNFREVRQLYYLTQLCLSGIVFFVALWMPEIYFLLIKNKPL
ncbi:MAG: hypothetical protein HQK54_05715, partial [Oligoflexales bacterium]|nr:hypothetical protein [Oligoflexales bacterium]